MTYHDVKSEPTTEQQAAKRDYTAWRRILRQPLQPNDLETIKSLWSQALDILDHGDRNWKQMLPRDLTNDEELHGYQHIQILLNMRVNIGGRIRFNELAWPFLRVIIHPALLDCLSVDSHVGDLYSFISGSGGQRAVQFFTRLSGSLLEVKLTSTTAEMDRFGEFHIAIATAIREVLRRSPRAVYHDDLPDLVESLKNNLDVKAFDKTSISYFVVSNRVDELLRMIHRAKGLLVENDQDGLNNERLPVVTSTYPRDIELPGGRHDNDDQDIAKVKIVPTEGEIRCNRAEFLPSTSFDQPHFLSGVERLLDTHFRLLRHDIFGEVKTTLSGLLDVCDKDTSLAKDPKLLLGDVHAYSYTSARISHLSFDKKRGVEAQLSFLQPHQTLKKNTAERRRWWQDSKRLEEGSLLCLVIFEGKGSSLLLFTVSQKITDVKDAHGLASGDYATITAKLASAGNEDHMRQLILQSLAQKRIQTNLIVEFPGVLLATFVPVLENIQQMQKESRLPFHEWIVPSPSSTSASNALACLDVPPPLYARKAGFTFNLKPILKNKGDFFLNPASTDNLGIQHELKERTSLDKGQCEALVTALTREFALIQGPPGTGKSYLGVQVMRVLIHNKKTAELGPVLVVCYTNHALDQFLEHLIEVGIDKIIRIGGESKSHVLEGKNLRLATQGEAKTGAERYLLSTLYREMEDLEGRIKSKLNALHRSRHDWETLKPHLIQKYSNIYSQFSRKDHEGFELVSKIEPFDLWRTGRGEDLGKLVDCAGTMKDLVQKANRRTYDLSINDRQMLLKYWLHEMHIDLMDDLSEAVQETEKVKKQIAQIHDEVDRRVLETAEVIGVTTSGLAKRIPVLRHIKTKVVVCEEAGEVLEAHMISALVPSVESLIQIGDYEQLRPQINNFKDLSLESPHGKLYQLDRSQFERLSVVDNGRPAFPISQLNVQRRMQPKISALIRLTLYPRLQDHVTVQSLPDVVGLRKNLFWLDHTNLEEGNRQDASQKSKSNLWEVDTTHALVRHIVRQGVYSSQDIAVLTPYSGQLQKLRNKMRQDFEIVLSDRDQDVLIKDGFLSEDAEARSTDVPLLQKKAMNELLRIATVDNFQGEEAKVIIVSLVRSNSDRKVGFLKTTNRINVLLSRAQHGMYLIGNSETYSGIPMWSQILGMLRLDDSVGNALALCCPRHTETELWVSEPEDFANVSPEGGCSLPCDKRLDPCGHRCLTKCHSEAMHKAFPCPQRCERLHDPCNHGCPKSCGENCGSCKVIVNSVGLPCGHIKDNVHCYQTLDPESIKCTEMVERQVPLCGHKIQVRCYQDVNLAQCPVQCEKILGCGHPCRGTCGTCTKTGNDEKVVLQHVKCVVVCGRHFGTCNHSCSRPCHGGSACGLCPSPCEVSCGHSRCNKKCHEPCAPCIQDCSWFCEHQGRCRMPCAAPCNRLPCSKRCTQPLPCGHQCPSLCGEICPVNYCQSCCSESKLEQRVDLLELKSFGEIDIDESPIVVLGCGHFFTAETLDGHMQMSEVYDQDINGDFIRLRDDQGSLAKAVPQCPDCQQPVRQFATQRYNRVINRAVMDEMSKRFLVDGKARVRKLELEIDRLAEELGNSRKEIVAGDSLSPRVVVNVNLKLEARDESSGKLIRAIAAFLKDVNDKNQPARKLHDATVKAARATESIDDHMKQLSIRPPVEIPRDRRIILGGRATEMKFLFTILADQLETAQALQAKSASTAIKIPGEINSSFFKACQSFITDCNAENLPKLNVEARLYFARAARLLQSYASFNQTAGTKATEYAATAREYLEEAKELCAQPFQNSETLLGAVDESLKSLRKEWYEPVSDAEIEAVKRAMVSGSSGIATHSGHWYNCQNGHPVGSLSSFLPSFPLFLPCVTPLLLPWNRLLHICTRMLTLHKVRHRRMRHANGASSVSRVRCPGWRVAPPSSGGRDEGGADGVDGPCIEDMTRWRPCGHARVSYHRYLKNKTRRAFLKLYKLTRESAR